MSINNLMNQLKLAFYEKDGNEFEQFIVSTYKIQYPDFLAIKPQGSKGDGANDGYFSGELLVQVYAPEKVDAKEAIKKINHDFKRAIDCGWDFTEWHFVINDKFNAVQRNVHHAIDELNNNNPKYTIKLIDSDTLKNMIIKQLENNRLRVYILLNVNKDISEFGDFEAVEKVIESISKEKEIRSVESRHFINFSEELFMPDGIKKLEMNIDVNTSPELFKLFGSHIEKSQEVMEEYIPQIGLDLFTEIGKYIQEVYKKYEKNMKPEIALCKTYDNIYKKLEDDANIQTALWIVIAYFFDICDIGKIK